MRSMLFGPESCFCEFAFLEVECHSTKQLTSPKKEEKPITKKEVEKESPQSNGYRLMNRHYFCGVNHGKENEEFWDEVYNYIDSHYDLSKYIIKLTS